jgi:hypothetical protein
LYLSLLLLLLALAVGLLYRELTAQRDFWKERCAALEDDLKQASDLRQKDQQAARERENALFDQALKRNGAKPLAPEQPTEVNKAKPRVAPPIDPVVYASHREAWIEDEVEDARDKSGLTGKELEERLAQVRQTAGIEFDKLNSFDNPPSQ